MELRARVGMLGPLIAALMLTGLAACSGGAGGAANEGQGSPQPDAVAAARLLDRFNYYRYLARVSAVSFDQKLSEGAQLHAQWLVSNNIDLGTVGLAAHDEIPGSLGYTLEGYNAGHSSVIYQGVGPVEAVDNWFRTFYHRLGLLDPNLQTLGFGMEGSFVVLDIVQGRTRGPLAQPSLVLYPSPGLTEVPVDYKREIPHPIPGDDSIGIPITAELFGPFGFIIHDVEAQILNLDTGVEVPYYLQTPGEPFLEEWDIPQVICLIPKDPLANGTHYQVSMRATLDGSQYSTEWVFTTR